MNDDTAATPSGASDLEARLRGVMKRRAGQAPVAAADWGDLAGRLASATHRRQRMFAAGAALSLMVGAAGGYFGEAAASTGTTAARTAAPMAGGTTATTVAGGKAAPSVAGGPSAAALCPAPSDASAGVGSAAQVFVRTTADGVTVRVYRLAAPSISSCLPAAPSGGPATPSTATTVAPRNAGAAGGVVAAPTTTTTSAPTAAASTFSVELSDTTAVGQGVLSSPLCVTSPGAGSSGTGSGSGSASSSSAGSAPGAATGGTASPGTMAPEPAPAPEPVTVPGAVTVPTVTTTVPASGGTTSTEPQQLSSGTFGVVEGDPVWWVAVQVAADVSSVRMTFADGSVDQMAPVDGIAVVAHHVSAATAGDLGGPYEVRGTLALLAPDGGTLSTVDLPGSQPPTPTPGPTPVPVPMPLSSAGSGTATTGADGSGSVSSVPPAAIVACPQPAAP